MLTFMHILYYAVHVKTHPLGAVVCKYSFTIFTTLLTYKYIAMDAITLCAFEGSNSYGLVLDFSKLI